MNGTKIRLWPAWTIVAALAVCIVLSFTPSISNFTRFVIMAGGPILGLLLWMIWLLFASRLPWSVRLSHLGIVVLAGAITFFIIHPSLTTVLIYHGIPAALLLFAAVVTRTRSWRGQSRSPLLFGVLVAGLSLFGLFRVDGVDGSYIPDFSWRWSETAEDRLATATEKQVTSSGNWAPVAVEWPAFRGPNGDGRAEGPAIPLDWADASPREAWRVAIGPGWSSFVFASGRLFTQEQRGEDETVSCFDASSGALIWREPISGRFMEVISGTGPRATPTISGDRIYSFSALGVLTAMELATGRTLWKHDLVAELEAPTPTWGFVSSPTIAAGVVVVHAGAPEEHGLVAFDVLTGEPVWHVATESENYGTPQRLVIEGHETLVFADASGILALEPTTGRELWRHKPAEYVSSSMVQPQRIGSHGVIVALGDGVGLARLEVRRSSKGWEVTEAWSSNRLKPAFNDYVIYQDNLYGFDQNIFAAISGETGERLWKGGRYGFGQVLLLERSGQLIVTSEKGDLLLLSAEPGAHREEAKLPLFAGKTWNHPIVVDETLFARNGEEMAAFDLGS